MLTEPEKNEVVVLRKYGFTINKIASLMHINRKTVMLWSQRKNETGSIDRKKGSGRPRITDADEDKKIVEIIKEQKENINIDNVQKNLKEHEIIISNDTLYRRFKENDYVYRYPNIKPILSEKHKQARLVWAHEHLNFKWANVIFSDEATIRLQQFVSQIWMKEDEPITIRSIKHPLKRNIWGCISKSGRKRIKIFSENMDSDLYTEILDDYLLPLYDNIKEKNKHITLQQDNDPKHTSKVTTEFLLSRKIKILPWPSNSPDLNPIENLWKLLKENIGKRGATNVNDFEKYIIEEWNKIDNEIIISLINSMPKRIALVIERNGDWIPY